MKKIHKSVRHEEPNNFKTKIYKPLPTHKFNIGFNSRIKYTEVQISKRNAGEGITQSKQESEKRKCEQSLRDLCKYSKRSTTYYVGVQQRKIG